MADERQLKGQREGVKSKRSQCHGASKESGAPLGPVILSSFSS